ncbi:envelope stress response membrane protein PspB [Aurantivibrio plasticivorans]
MTGSNIIGLVAVIMVFSIPLCLIWARVLVIRYRSQQAEVGTAEAEELQRLDDLAEKLSQRVATLESILDSEIPGWRDEHEQ